MGKFSVLSVYVFVRQDIFSGVCSLNVYPEIQL